MSQDSQSLGLSSFLSVSDALKRRAQEEPQRLAYRFLKEDGREETITYGELDSKARSIALTLEREGLRGSRALLLYPPGLEFIIAFFGCLYGGAVAVPAYPPGSQRSLPRLKAIVDDAKPAIALTTSPLVEKFSALARRMPDLASLRWQATDVLEDVSFQASESPVLVKPEQLAFLQYTSGSTSAPKGVMVSHGNLAHNQRMIQRAFELTREDVIVGWLPLYHDMGLIGNVLQPLYIGASCILMSPVTFLRQPFRWLETISTYRGTTSGGPNFSFDLCVRKISPEQRKSLDLSSWKVAFNGAEPVRAETLDRFAKTFVDVGFDRSAFFPCYGLAEGTLLVTGGSVQAPPVCQAFAAAALEEGKGEPSGTGHRLVSSGQACGGQEVLLVDPQSCQLVDEGVVGEIWVAGGSVAQGYWEKPSQSARDFGARLRNSSNSYLRTGDLGFQLDGEVFVTGRLKDLIILRGRNLYPHDLELSVEQSHSDLRAGCGTAFSVSVDGEEKLVVVQEVVRRPSGAGFQEILAAATQALATEYGARLHDLVLIRWGSIPKTSSGKLRRNATKMLYLQGELLRASETLSKSVPERDGDQGKATPVAEWTLRDAAAIRTLAGEQRTEALRESLLLLAAKALEVSPSALSTKSPLTSCGLDSLGAVEFQQALEKALGLRISLASLLDGASVEDLVSSCGEAFGVGADSSNPGSQRALVGASTDAVALVASRRPAATDQCLSAGQEALWFLQRLNPESAANHIVSAVDIHGPFSTQVFRNALVVLAGRHEALRTTFLTVAGEPVARVSEDLPPETLLESGEGLSESEITEFLHQEVQRPFDLEKGPLWRVAIVRCSEERHALALSMHHLVGDFWSLSLLMEELRVLYEGFSAGQVPALPELSLRFGDFASWDRQRREAGELDASWSAWQEILKGALPELELPTDRPRPPVQTDAGGVCGGALDRDATEALVGLAERTGVTRFTVLAAALAAVLHRLSGQSRVAVGTPTSGRVRPELAPIVGYFANPVVLLSAAQPNLGFDSWVKGYQSIVASALEHQELPFPLLAERLRPVRDPSRSPLFQVLLTLHRAHRSSLQGLAEIALGEGGGCLDLGAARISSRPLKGRSVQFELSFVAALVGGSSSAAHLRSRESAPENELSKGLRLRVALQYNRDLYDSVTAQRLLDRWFVLLERAVTNPQQALAEISLMRPAEEEELLLGCTGPSDSFPGITLLDLVTDRACMHAERIAIVAGGEEWSYGLLEGRANQLARYLLQLGVGPETPVGILSGGSAWAVAALLGVLKAGGSYVPIDPTYPRDRIALMLQDSGTPVVLAESSSLEALGDFSGEVVVLDPEAKGHPWSEQPTESLERDVCGETRAYVIYTSGSTGRPKGVQVSHRAVVNFLHSMAVRPGLLPEDRLVAVTTLSFDISGLEFFLPLVVGARVIFADRATATDGGALLRLLADSGGTAMQATPSTWRLLLAAGWEGDPRIKVLCGGEVLPADLARDLARRGQSLWNLYGPTETTIWSATDRLRLDLRGDVDVTIGEPIHNTSIYVVDKGGRWVPPGVAGELLIGGSGLSRGYLGQPALTAEKFCPDPYGTRLGGRLYRTGDLARRRREGRFECLGRLDDQVKVRGHRIEIGEIETALSALEDVDQAVVTSHRLGTNDARLVAYVIPRDEMPRLEDLRRALQETLPQAFLPSLVVPLERFPLTPNGKVDRRALPDPSGERPDLAVDFQAPESSLEREIAGLWVSTLGLEAVGVDDNFFDLGGHSLLVAKIHSSLEESLGITLSMVDLFRYPTVRSLASYIREAGAAPVASPALQTEPSSVDRDIAVIGLAGRFPGATNIEDLWQKLRDGEELLSFFSQEELLEAGHSLETLQHPDYVRASGYLEDADLFDAEFFGIHPREAATMDPQHRIFLECAWEGLESAGYDSTRYEGRVGVFAGVGIQTYAQEAGLADLPSSAARYQAFVGNDKDFVPTRVSYKLNLKGPSLNVQTACSSSLVAVHLGIQSLLSGECDMALAGGCTVRTPLKSGYLYEEGGIPSPDGHCRPFDSKAAGTVFGNGAAVVLLKPLDMALRDGDRVRAVIRGSAINNDGADKIGFTAPSVDGQAAVIASALARASVPAETISYVEAHGTGTPLGDPIEVAALRLAMGEKKSLDDTATCALGSIKGNIGHLDTAAGAAGLIKVVLALEKEELPPSLYFDTPNPKLELKGSRFFVNSHRRDWFSEGTHPRRAGVSSFGIGGTNAHVILEEAPTPATSSLPCRPSQLLVVSARSEDALGEAVGALVDALAVDSRVADVAFTLSQGRTAFPHRMAIVCNSISSAQAGLRGDTPEAVSRANGDSAVPSVAFLFSGQGAQYPGMGAELYRTEEVFRTSVDSCCELLKPFLGMDLRSLLFPESLDEQHLEASAASRGAPPEDSGDLGQKAPNQAALKQTANAQPALFVIEYSLARLWLSWGIAPTAMMGHSIGEYVAACLAGVFELPAALRLVTARGRLMQSLPAGAMLAVELPEDEVMALLGSGLSLAAINGPRDTVISGPNDAVVTLAATLEEKGVQYRRLVTSHAFHSEMMQPILEAFRSEVFRAAPKPPKVPVVSNVTGTWMLPEQATDPDYWVHHLRGTVRFAEGVEKLLEEPGRFCLEIGPGQALVSLARRVGAPLVAASLRHPKQPGSDSAQILRTLGRLWVAGARVDWNGFWGDERRQRMPLPTYPFERQRFWLDSRPSEAVSEDRRPDLKDWFSTPLWHQAAGLPPALPNSEEPWLLFADDEGWVGRLAEILDQFEGGPPWTIVQASDSFEVLASGAVCVRPGRDEDFRSLLAHLAQEQKSPQVIVHGWCLSSPSTGTDAKALYRELDRTRALGLESLVALARALDRTGGQEEVRWSVLVNDLFSVTGEPTSRPDKATVLGLVQTLPLESPRHSLRCIDIDVEELRIANESVLLHQVIAEAAAPVSSEERLVALAKGRRWIRGEGKVSVQGSGASCRVREGGVYLITGGGGGIGMEIAEDLAERVRPRLVLLGRRSFPSRGDWQRLVDQPDLDPPSSALAQRFQALESKGAQVLPLTADVTNARSLADALGLAAEAFGPLDGVIHAAGVPGGAMLQGRQASQGAAVMAPKVEGTLLLQSLLQGHDLDFFALFSSVTGTLGGFGQTDYSAANAFLDAFAASALATSAAYTVAIGWDRWEEVGMARQGAHSQDGSFQGGPNQEGRPTGHPFLGQLLEESQDRSVFSAELSPDRQWVLSEHLIAGHPTVPGTTFLEMARAAFQHRRKGEVQISDVVFLAPLSVPEGSRRQVLTVLQSTSEVGGTFSVSSSEALGAEQAFRIFSRPADHQEDEWSEHARGAIAVSASPAPAPLDLETLDDLCRDRVIAFEDRVLGAHGTFLQTGPRWHSLQKMTANGSKSLAEIEIAPEFVGDLDQLHLHPALLDVAAGAVQFLAEGHFLPLSYERIVLREALPRRFFSHFRLREGGTEESLTCDLSLLAADGREIAAVTGFSMRRIREGVATRLAVIEESPRTARGILKRPTLPWPTPPGQGIRTSEGRQALQMILESGTVSRVLVTPRELAVVRRDTWALDRARLESELSVTGAKKVYDRPEVSSDFIAPEDDLERRIAAVWQSVLGLDRIGINDNFFELGGSSLNGVQLVAELKAALGVDIPTVSIFEAPTVSGLARYLSTQNSEKEQFSAARQRAQRKRGALPSRRRVAPRRKV